ncbi:MAG: hypothetical protein HON14_15455 [Rhodospirillaceae bacterium]|jgi:hypothetical protein|nr:hypothetical protein [Rhodospirillaceae bacterium]MBT4940531.1 hypothetical protein [Rhodospirillaceae bacterium]MBT5938336.1 hypothetical protein [Rhodospirillaceae bacterium]MBT7266267.1 hypothetical protein [Rhodospirillaceae bacterium]
MNFLFKVASPAPQKIIRKHWTTLAVLPALFFLLSCQTTTPTGEAKEVTLDPGLERIRFEKMFNVDDIRECKLQEGIPAAKITIIDRGKLCVLAADMSEFEANAIADAAEISYQKVVSFLDLQYPRKITITVKEEGLDKPPRAYAPVGRIIVPKRIFKNGIHEGVLIHEITHTLMGLSGPFVARIERTRRRRIRHLVSSGLLNEGLAGYMDSALADRGALSYRKINAHKLTYKHLLNKINYGLLAKLHRDKKLFLGHGKPSKKKKLVARYIIAGSFVRYLIENYGVFELMRVYQGMTFLEVYTKDINSLQEEWLFYMTEHYFPDVDTLMNANTEARKLKTFSRISDKLICRKMDIDEIFVEEGKRRELNKLKCDEIMDLNTSS